MIDKLEAYKKHQEKFIDVVRQAGANDAFVAACEKANALSFALLDDMVNIIGQLDVDVAEMKANAQEARAALGFVDQHGAQA